LKSRKVSSLHSCPEDPRPFEAVTALYGLPDSGIWQWLYSRGTQLFEICFMSFEVFALITYIFLRLLDSLGDYIGCAAFLAVTSLHASVCSVQ
jgi:hypothetical protein